MAFRFRWRGDPRLETSCGPAASTAPAVRAGPGVPLDPGALISLQHAAGNRAVVQRLVHPVVQRDPEGTPKQRVAKAVEEGKPELIAALDDEALAAATADQRLKLIRVLNEQGGSFQRIKLARLWDGFGGQLRATADANAADWKKSFEVAPSIMRSSFNVMGQRKVFYLDVVHVATDFLDQNEQYCKNEFGRLGLTETGDVQVGPPTEQQTQALQAARDDATKLAADQEALADLRNVIVGYASVEFPPGGTGPPVYLGPPARFDPVRPPGHGPLESDRSMKTWDDVKKHYDALNLLIRARLMVNPTLFPLARGAHEDPGKAKVVSTGAAPDALKTLGDGLKEVLANIAKTRPMLSVLAPDLEPIQGQLIAGTRAAAADRNWNASPFYAAVAADMVEERKPGPWWETLGLAAAQAGAYVVAGLATGGTAIAVGLAAKGAADTALAAGKAQALEAAYGATTTEEMSLISEGQVDHAKAEVIETAAFALLDTVVAAGTVRGALRSIRQVEKVAVENAAKASARADRWIADELAKDAKDAAATARAELPAVTADADAAAKAAQDVENAAKSATPEEAARAQAALQKSQAAAGRAKTAAEDLQAAADGKRVPRAKPVLDPNGLGSKASYDATVAAARKEIGSAWATMTEVQRQAKVTDVVAARMRAQGVPGFANVVHKPGTGGAAADWRTWNLHLDPALLNGKHSMESIVALVYHEAAHFEDFINVARYELGQGLTPAEIQLLTGIDSRGVQAAVAKGALTPAAAEFGRAKAVFDSIWGASKGKRDAIYRTMTLTKLDYELEELRLFSVVDKQTGNLLPGKAVADLHAVTAQLQAKAASRSSAIKAYEKLPEEIQAYGVQEGLTQSFERAAFRRQVLAAIAAIVAAGGTAAGLKALLDQDK